MFEWALWGGRAAELALYGHCVVIPGVAVKLTPQGAHVAVVYGGYKSQVDVDAAVASARAALADWPEMIYDLRLHVTVDPPKNKYTRLGRRLRGLPS